MTKPPAQHTDASLLLAMENAGKELEDETLREQMKGSGIGTPATRASIIERLVQVGYVQRKGKTLLATPKGIALIGIMPAEIASPETTGRWEKALDEITTGKQDPARFMEGIRKLSAFLVRYARENQKPAHFPEDARQKKFRAQQAQRRVSQAKAVDGVVCPLCGQGKVLESQRSFFCSRLEEGCHFTLWKDTLTRGGGPELSARLVALLLAHRALRGSTGTIVLTENGSIAFIPPRAGSPQRAALPALGKERRLSACLGAKVIKKRIQYIGKVGDLYVLYAAALYRAGLFKGGFAQRSTGCFPPRAPGRRSTHGLSRHEHFPGIFSCGGRLAVGGGQPHGLRGRAGGRAYCGARVPPAEGR